MVATISFCDQCRRGDFAICTNRKVTGVDFDGGYAEYMIAPAEALAAIPDELSAEEAGPFMCAGVTVFNALRNSGARAVDLAAEGKVVEIAKSPRPCIHSSFGDLDRNSALQPHAVIVWLMIEYGDDSGSPAPALNWPMPSTRLPACRVASEARLEFPIPNWCPR
jgi:hypothetical protein